jgi:hypothetical protein
MAGQLETTSGGRFVVRLKSKKELTTTNPRCLNETVASILQKLLQTPFGELVTGRAHFAHPTDVTVSLGERFAGRSLLLIYIALDQAATVRVAFDAKGTPTQGTVRNNIERGTPEFIAAVSEEARVAGAEWAVVAMGTGWQMQLGERASRTETGSAPFERFRLLSEEPGLLVPKAQVERVYGAVDHPTMDKSLVFSLARAEIEKVVEDISRCGLRVAAVRIGVAAQLETWLARKGDEGLRQDLLVTDGLSAALVNIDVNRDFALPEGAEKPRQAVKRPTELKHDLTRFLRDNGERPVTFLGSAEMAAAAQQALAPNSRTQISYPPEEVFHDCVRAVLERDVRHDLHPEIRPVRPSLPRRWRRYVVTYLVAGGLLTAVAITNILTATLYGIRSNETEAQTLLQQRACDRDKQSKDKLEKERVAANTIQAWVSANYHAQGFLYGILRNLPQYSGIQSLTAELAEGGPQMTLTFGVLGNEETQVKTANAVEQALLEQHFSIGDRGTNEPLAGGRGVKYSWRLLVPASGEYLPQ